MLLYHERQLERAGEIDVRDEEECYTAKGRRMGVWLSTEAVQGQLAFHATVDPVTVEPYEVSGDDAVHRVFVVPGALVAELGFRATS
jgi:hypothetical protein